jgi:subtilase family serine protease
MASLACGEPYPKALCPTQVEGAYNVTALHNEGINGTGQGIVIVDACGNPNIASDLKTFDKQFHLPAAKLNVYYPQGKCSTDYGWGIEISLDVEWSHVIAPGATINLVVANQPTFGDLFGAWTYAMQHHLGKEISNSWGGTQSCQASTIKQLKQATAANITVLAATGDSGAWPSGPGSNPANCGQVLGVGGTTLSTNSGGAYKGESAWSGGGGGYVSGTKEPSYQTTVKIKDPTHVIAKPDVAAVADYPNSPVWVYNSNEGYQWVQVGGTSVACPLWASFLADVNQIRTSNGFGGAGFVTPFLYLTVYGVSGGSPLYHTNMHDVKTGSNGFPAGKGWDAATGLGSFNAGMLAWTLGNNKQA